MSWIKSPNRESSSSPTGVAKDVGSWETFIISLTLVTSICMASAISSGAGSRPSSCISFLESFRKRLIVSTI